MALKNILLEEALKELQETFKQRSKNQKSFLSKKSFTKLFGSILNTVADGVFIVNLLGDVLFINNEMCRMWDVQPDIGSCLDIIRFGASQATDPDYFIFRTKLLYDDIYIETKDVFSLIDGRYIERLSRPLWFQDKIIGRICTNRDVSAHIQMEQTLKDRERTLQNIFDGAPIGTTIVDLNGRYLKVNRSFAHMVGYPESELLNLTFAEITHPEDIDNSKELFNRLVLGEIPQYRVEKRYICKDQSIAHILLQVTILHDEHGEPIHSIGQAINITQQRKTMDALLQHQKMESVGLLAGGIAHDFNNLLVALKAQTYLARVKLPPQSEAISHLEKAESAADSASQLTRELLAYSGQGQFEKISLNLNVEIARNIHLLEVAIDKNIVVSTDFDETLPVIITDSGHIQQVLLNLILNASEAINRTGGEIEIKTSQVILTQNIIENDLFTIMPSAPGRFVVLQVKDSGQGMSTDILNKIFDPFFTTKLSGRGLGLAAVFGIVRSNNGGLMVESEVGKGSVFKIYFPVRDEHNPPDQPQPLDESNPKENLDKKYGTVLIIDDDKHVQEALIDVFHLENINQIWATNGLQGIDQLRTHSDQIDLVLLDLSMPGISSEETFKELRKIKPDLPIILCSGFSEKKVINNFANLNYDLFIKKPFDISATITKIRQYFS